ncbi:FAD-binding oxidoreductase [Lutimaribacter saemankumensis]|uniref:FAD/FMN-containing dehydrogenase n=1 Tax=Lutimaribacter saemankumensis TaxID=490829 RepID=A0A1G8MKQ9_9RHOB|nr:FAD-binding oxidoreductase [Lutimaribacter saemankumensis]SDI67910.1 FAD/FMN-containing dehydrogenase [Lutimaribacter saemankumensis]
MLKDADQDFVDQLRAVLPERAIRTPEARHLEEPRGQWTGQAAAVVAPGSVDEVSAVLRACNDAKIGVVPYGGGTGLVGGQVAGEGPLPILLSLERMAAIRAVHPEENVIEVEAGAILQDVHTAAEAVDRLYPLSIASKGSARIGGLLGTNAGGVNVLRYGNARDLCLGVEVVLADGRVWNGMSRLRKDNTGYDLRNLMIGSEGTLGVITAASLKLAPRPAGEGTALMVVDSPAAALSLLALARDRMGEGISAFEIMHRMGLEFLTEKLPDIRQPFDTPPEWFVLIDVGLAAGLDPAEALEALFADAFDRGLVSDGMIAQSETQRHEFWEVREQIPEANRRVGSISSHDISLPMGAVATFIEQGGAALARLGDFRINCFGHLGDGNLHYNVFPPKGRDKSEFHNLRDDIKTCVHDLVDAMGGSVSAEHGIGRLKVGDLERYGHPVKLEVMRGIKALLDPNGILNPGAVLRAGG